MKNKTKIIGILLISVLVFALFAACGISYAPKTLAEGTVGIFYSQDIADAVGADGQAITYGLAEGSTLPAGLKIENGAVTGIPEEAADDHKFTVVASDGSAEGEATFSITIARGAVVYESGTHECIVGREDSGTVATATNAVNVTYEVIDGLEDFNSRFEGKLSVAADGTIKGVYGKERTSRTLKVRASAKDCEPAVADVIIDVVNPYFDYDGQTLADARQNVPYAASVALVRNVSGVNVTYRLKTGSTLPSGLRLASDGTVTGTATNVGPAEPFTVVASGSGYSNTEAEFGIDVILDHVSDVASKIVNFAKNEPTVLETAYDGTFYVNQSGVAGNASALNGNNITYSLATDGENFPAGFNLYANGAVFGVPSVRGEYTFDVTASAAGCPDVTQTFVLAVQGSRIVYQSINGLLTRGETCDYDIAKASAGDGAAITYSVSDADAATLLGTYGLTVTADGRVTGTPKISVKSMNFKVTASAEGYTSTTATVYFRIREPLAAAKRFEAEYTVLSGKSGTGYSGSPTEENLITSNAGASNGYFVNYLHNDSITLEFVIWSDTAVANASLTMGLGSELNNITLTPSVFGVYVYDSDDVTTGNKTTVNYGSVTVTGGYKNYTDFQSVSFGGISLAQGYNTIQLAVHANTFKDGVTGGPGVDYIEIDAASTLKWHPCLYNIK